MAEEITEETSGESTTNYEAMLPEVPAAAQRAAERTGRNADEFSSSGHERLDEDTAVDVAHDPEVREAEEDLLAATNLPKYTGSDKRSADIWDADRRLHDATRVAEEKSKRSNES